MVTINILAFGQIAGLNIITTKCTLFVLLRELLGRVLCLVTPK